MADVIAPWTHPIVLGSRLCWFDGERNVVIPIMDVRPLYTDDRSEDLEKGYMATLPTENGATVDVTYDPEVVDDKSPMTQWLYVRHPEYGYLIDAKVEDGHIVYDPSCLGEKCPGPCRWCGGFDSQWWEYVTSPGEVMSNLAWLGSLPIKAVNF